MDQVLPLLPVGTVGTALLAVIVYLLRQNYADRVQYRNDVAATWAQAAKERTAQEERHAAEIAAMDQRRTAENRAVQERIDRLEATNAKVVAAYEDERNRRWAAEEETARLRQAAEKGPRL